MAELNAQVVQGALLFGALKGLLGQRVGALFNVVPVVPVVALPVAWINWPNAGFYVGPLLGQVQMAKGAAVLLSQGGNAVIGGAVMVSSAGKPFVFSSAGSFSLWGAIAAARLVREVELVEAMATEARAVWLAKKRAALEKAARNRINAAAKIADAQVRAAVIDDASFALAKWGHYA